MVKAQAQAGVNSSPSATMPCAQTMHYNLSQQVALLSTYNLRAEDLAHQF